MVKNQINKQSWSRLDALSKLLNVFLVIRIHKMRTQADSDEKNTVNDFSIRVCFDWGPAILLLFHRYAYTASHKKEHSMFSKSS